MLRTGRRGDEDGIVTLPVESVPDALAGWPLLLRGQRRREPDSLEAPFVVQQRHAVEVHTPPPQISW